MIEMAVISLVSVLGLVAVVRREQRVWSSQ